MNMYVVRSYKLFMNDQLATLFVCHNKVSWTKFTRLSIWFWDTWKQHFWLLAFQDDTKAKTQQTAEAIKSVQCEKLYIFAQVKKSTYLYTAQVHLSLEKSCCGKPWVPLCASQKTFILLNGLVTACIYKSQQTGRAF